MGRSSYLKEARNGLKMVKRMIREENIVFKPNFPKRILSKRIKYKKPLIK